MKYAPDAYLLHEAGQFITYNIRIKIVLKDEINPEIFKEAAKKAFNRFPYFHKQITIDETGGIDFIQNPRELSIYPVNQKKPSLFSEESNYHPCSIEYEGKCLYFNMYHGMCGGSGTFKWIKTTIREYIKAAYKVELNAGSTILVEDPILEEEYIYPLAENIPAFEIKHHVKEDEVWFPKLDYLLGFINLKFSDSLHHEIIIPKKDLMKYVQEIEGSPMSVMTAVLFKALKLALPKETLPMRGKSNHNIAKQLSCANTYHDLLNPLYYFMPQKALDWPLEKLCTIIRGMTFVQSEDDYAYARIQEFYDVRKGIDETIGFKEKSQYSTDHSFYKTKLHSSFNINYVGKEDWGDLIRYVDQAYIVTDGHILMEICDVGDHFCISFMQMVKNKTYLDCIFKVLKDASIPYQYMGAYKNHLPTSKVMSAPVIRD